MKRLALAVCLMLMISEFSEAFFIRGVIRRIARRIRRRRRRRQSRKEAAKQEEQQKQQQQQQQQNQTQQDEMKQLFKDIENMDQDEYDSFMDEFSRALHKRFKGDSADKIIRSFDELVEQDADKEIFLE